MSENNKKRTNRIRNMIFTTVMMAVLLSVSTYAWFIGLRTVNVESFDVEIASTDSLLLSLDGERWDTTVRITQETLNEVSYANHTNSWGGRGLIPMSSVGEMDPAASRMKIFEKASLTSTAGGYRLLSSRIPNYGKDTNGVDRLEQEGYVAFDLFVKNFTGAQYITELNPLDEEAIYLTTDSAVTVASTGVANTGIENSVRVAFTQIGRVAQTITNPSTITGITCNASEEGTPTVAGDVTGICRDAQIWEPNDTFHVANAISWYNTTCKARTGENVRDKDSYDGSCGPVANGIAYPTYAVTTPITSADNVDIYDGLAFNKYEDTTELLDFPYFRDTHKIKAGTERPEFMTLAPSSITKLRVYIYIEGQDIDNYDFASIGKKIAVKFGFTKERLNPEDIDYPANGGPVINPGTDTEKPTITLTGDETATVAKGEVYTDAGATAEDTVDGDITRKIRVINPVNTAVAGTYYVTYNVSDWAGNYAAQVVRTVTVTE